ncbi:anti-sigma regulatory factor [Chondromyces apiculatus]|uniref:anti-sigma regulatory factor n=1 Tax=Chondromyces apiculatus TaxID=51 RepID=UPI001E51F90C|nr:anti-sigma regulatory factor [Chondromyces apiculatus]
MTSGHTGSLQTRVPGALSSNVGAPSSVRPGPPSFRGGSTQPTRLGVVGITDRIEGVLAQFLSPAVRKSVIDCGVRQARVDRDSMREADLRRLLVEVKRGVQLFVRDQVQLERCVSQLNELDYAAPAPREILIDVRTEEDVLRARSAGRELCIEQMVSDVLLTKIVTAISELGRNIVRYAGSGEITVRTTASPQRAIEICAKDQGPGITNLPEILSGRYRSRHGMGAGLRGTKALMDDFDIQTGPGKGTMVTVRKFLG